MIPAVSDSEHRACEWRGDHDASRISHKTTQFSAFTTNPARNQKGWVLTTTDQGVTNYILDVSTFTKVWPGPVAKLRIMTASQAPLEGSLPTSAGKTNPNSPGSATAGVAFPVIIQAVDANTWNTTNFGLAPLNLSANTWEIRFICRPMTRSFKTIPLSSMINGQLTTAFAAFTPRTRANQLDILGGRCHEREHLLTKPSQVSTCQRLLEEPKHFKFLLPGEFTSPGSGQYPTNGKTGTPTAQTAGSAIPHSHSKL